MENEVKPESTLGGSQRLLTRQEAASFLGVRPNTLAWWECMNRPHPQSIRIGRLVRYQQTDLDEFVQKMREESCRD